MILGCDVSFYNDDDMTLRQIDFGKMKLRGAEFVIVRAGQNVARDPDWRYNWGKAEEASLLRGAYWVHDYRRPALYQAQAFALVMREYPVEVPVWWDLEYVASWGERPRRVNLLPALRDALAFLTEELKITPVLYTNPDMILNILSPIPDWLVQYPLAVAHYGVDKPQTGPWKTWTFWQYTSKGEGAEFGVESKNIDLDWFNGNRDELLAFCSIGDTQPSVPLPAWARSIDLWARTQGYQGPRPGGLS